jgi:hypothetical protein
MGTSGEIEARAKRGKEPSSDSGRGGGVAVKYFTMRES